MPKQLVLCDLLDIYGALLTQKQRRLLELYYYEDFSLSEISETEGVSRQGAQEVIKRAEHTLYEMEAALGIHARQKEQRKILAELREALQRNDTGALRTGLARLEDTCFHTLGAQ